MTAATPGGLRPEEIPDVEELTVDECQLLLRQQSVGRIAVRAGEGVDIFPVNFIARDGNVFIRSAPGSKLIDIGEHPEVAFEIDGAGRHTRWSVVVKGPAQRLSFDSEITESGVLGLETLTSSAKWNYLRITGRQISGRRFRG